MLLRDQREERDRLRVHGVEPGADLPATDPRHTRFLETMLRNVRMAGLVSGADIVHCHTWYAHFAGCLLRQLDNARLVLTTHSLEPHRPGKWSNWEAPTRQLLGRENGVPKCRRRCGRIRRHASGRDGALRGAGRQGAGDSERHRPGRVSAVERPEILQKHGVDPSKPFVLFVGRITRQKGIVHLVNAIEHLHEGTQVVLCAGAPDTEILPGKWRQRLPRPRSAGRHDILWLADMLPREETIALYAGASVFVCPSVYEPFGIINLEAMACETAVVASAVGGIPGIVVDGETACLCRSKRAAPPISSRRTRTGFPEPCGGRQPADGRRGYAPPDGRSGPSPRRGAVQLADRGGTDRAVLRGVAVIFSVLQYFCAALRLPRRTNERGSPYYPHPSP